eukprot:COSAG04_NODE_450_length_14158_cov_17.389573_17_plen_89_part_00
MNLPNFLSNHSDHLSSCARARPVSSAATDRIVGRTMPSRAEKTRELAVKPPPPPRLLVPLSSPSPLTGAAQSTSTTSCRSAPPCCQAE